MTAFTIEARTRVIRGAGEVRQLGEVAREVGARRPLVVSESGVVAAGCAEAGLAALRSVGLEPVVYSSFGANPDTAMAEQARQFAVEHRTDVIIGLGGGSSMDLAKAVGFLVSNGGSMRDYWGYNKAANPLPPMLGVPTTTGTGSEAQSYALISDAETHRKMACGAPTAAFRTVILDPELTLTQPFEVRATSGFDAITHAVETWVTRTRTEFSDLLSGEAWRLLSENFEMSFQEPKNLQAAGAMQWGAYLAGWAIEQSMLGAAHACANPLTQRYGTVHGRALAVMLPCVVAWNHNERYARLDPALPDTLRRMIAAAQLPQSLRSIGVAEADLPDLASRAAEQWTAKHNPRPFHEVDALEVYRCAF